MRPPTLRQRQTNWNPNSSSWYFSFLIVKHSVCFYDAKLPIAQEARKGFARFFLIVEYHKKTSAVISFSYD